MNGEVVYYSIRFFQSDDRTPLVGKDGKQICREEQLKVKADRWFWSDWYITIPNADFLGAKNFDKNKKQCSFDIIVRDGKDRILGSVNNKKIRIKQN